VPPPTPPPIPPPAPAPTQTVVVNIPPELVDRFAPHGPWLTGPIATLIAAAVALLAAGIAFWAVNRQMSGNAASITKQIDAGRAQQRRAERLDLVAEAAHLVYNLDSLAAQHDRYSGKWANRESSEAGQLFGQRMVEVEERFYELTPWVVVRKLDLLGMSEASKAVEEVYTEASRVIRPIGEEKSQKTDAAWHSKDRPMHAKKKRAIAALKNALDEV
jgi:hypothetical protein